MITIIVDGNECEHSLVLMKPWRHEHAYIVTFEVCVMPKRHYRLYLFLCVNVFFCIFNLPPISFMYCPYYIAELIYHHFLQGYLQLICLYRWPSREHLYCVYENIYIVCMRTFMLVCMRTFIFMLWYWDTKNQVRISITFWKKIICM